MSRGPRRGIAFLQPGATQSRWLQAVAPGELTWHQQTRAASQDTLEQTWLPEGYKPSPFSFLINHITAENI